MFLSSCFTGIENTKKINLSREDKKNSLPTPEEKFMAEINGVPLKEWETGRPFIVADNKALFIIPPQQGLLSSPPDSIKGEIFRYAGLESKMNVAGNLTVKLLFTDGTYIYAYDTGKEFDQALEEVKSSQIPMLIDVELIDKVKNLLIGKKLWSKSNLWYDSTGNRIDGKKFVEVTVIDVSPGDMVFPLSVKIKTDSGEEAYLYMNFGNGDTESRAFHNLFSLSDPRKHFPGIDPETWDLISRGKIRIGMTKEECKLALGNPSDINSGHDYSQTIDIWSYENGRVLWFEDGRLVRLRQ